MVSDPVHFPSFSAIVGERLFEVGRGCAEVSPLVADENRFVVDRVDSIELADAILEFADLGRVEDAGLLVGPVEPPLMRLGIVSAQGKTFNMAGRAIGTELINFGAVVDFSADAGAVVVHPCVGASERIDPATQVVFPRAEKRIEIARAAGQGARRLKRFTCLCAGWAAS